jgi:hypothetical protein
MEEVVVVVAAVLGIIIVFVRQDDNTWRKGEQLALRDRWGGGDGMQGM